MSTRIRCLILICGLITLCCSCSYLSNKEETREFHQKVFGSKSVFNKIRFSRSIELFILTGERETRYLSEGNTIASYPIKSGPIQYNEDSMGQLVSFLTDEMSYDFDAKLGAGFPCWDGMLSIYSPGMRIDVMLWSSASMIRVFKNGKAVGHGHLGAVHDEFSAKVKTLLASGGVNSGPALKNQD